MNTRPPVYDRVATNRRKTRLLLALAAAMGLPYAIAIGVFFFLPVALIAAAVVLSALQGAGPHVSQRALTLAALAALVIAMVATFAIVRSAIRRFGAWLVLRLTHARPIDAAAFADLGADVKEVCGAARLPVPALAIVDTPEPNAFAVGWTPETATVVVTRGLLALLGPREVQAVIAQQMAHVGNEDTRVGTTLAVMVAAFAWPAVLPFSLLSSENVLRRYVGKVVLIAGGLFVLGALSFSALALAAAIGDPDVRMIWSSAPLLWQSVRLAPGVSPIYIFVVAPLIALAMRSAVWEQRELLTDAQSSLITLDPAGLAHALMKVGAAGGTRLHPASAAHLFIADPFAVNQPFWHKWFPTHGSIEERVDVLRQRFRAIDGLEKAAAQGTHYREALASGQAALALAVAFSEQPSTPAADVVERREAAGRGDAGLDGATDVARVADSGPHDVVARGIRRRLSISDLNARALYRAAMYGIIGLVFLQPGFGMIFGIPILIYAFWPLLALLGEERIMGPCPHCGSMLDTGLPGVPHHVMCPQCHERVEIRGDQLIARVDEHVSAPEVARCDNRRPEPQRNVPSEFEVEATIPVYEQPDGWSAVVAMSRPDDVSERADDKAYGNFVKVRLTDGRTGYVARSARRP